MTYISQHINKHMVHAETSFARVHNDLLCRIHDGRYVVLLLLDLSAAFDTVDNIILLNRL